MDYGMLEDGMMGFGMGVAGCRPYCARCSGTRKNI